MSIQLVCRTLALLALSLITARADSSPPAVAHSPSAPAASSPARTSSSPSTPADPAVAPGDHDGQSDFDFVVGTWKVRNRVLESRLQGSTTWYEYDAKVIERAIWDGKAIVEEWDGVSPKRHVQGLAVRLYDPAARQWKIWWADREYATIFSPPSVGSFKGGRGEFFAGEGLLPDGRPFRSRCIWTKLTKDKLRWEQAYSGDGGKTWETNWIMDFTRAAP